MASALPQLGADVSTPSTASGVAVSKPQKELLDNNSVMETFLNMLDQRGVTVEQSTLHTDNITVTAGDVETARQCLRAVIHTETLRYNPNLGVPPALRDLTGRFPGEFAHDIDAKQGRVDLAFLQEVSGEVLPVLQDLKTPRKLVPLPDYLAIHLQRRLHSFRTKFNSQLGGADVGLDLYKDTEGKNYVQYRCEPDRVPAVQNVLEKMLKLFWYFEIDTSRAHGLFLMSSEGQKLLKGTEDKSGCTVQVETTEELVLFTARSPQGCHVMLCEGNMASSDCDVLVLPLAEGQEEWPPAQKVILERAYLPLDVRMHSSRVGLPPKPQVIALQCQWMTPGQRVVVMYIPAPDHDQFNQLVSQAVKEALRVSSDRKIGLGLPLKLSEDVSFDVTSRLLLQTVVDNCDVSDSLTPVKLYVDVLPEFQELVNFFETNGWTCEAKAEDNHYMDRVRVTIGDIFNAQKIKADAVVNSTDPGLELVRGQVSSVIAKKGGHDLIQYCKQHHTKGFENQAVVVTESFELTQFKYIFHVALPLIDWDKGDEADLLENLRSRVEACLLLASIRGLKTIVFPALGTGVLRYPPDKEAKSVLRATKDFFTRLPHSSLQLVTYVSYEKNLDVAKVFKAEETVYRYAAFRPPCTVEECRYMVGKGLVQVVKGDPLLQLCTAGLLVLAEKPVKGKPEDYRKMAAKGCNVQTVNPAAKLVNTIRDIVQSSTETSVQINLQTFDSRHVEEIVSGVEKGLSSARTVHLVILIVPTSQILHQIYEKSSRYKPTKTVPEIASGRAIVAICGEQKAVKQATAEIKAVCVPATYTEAEQFSIHQRFLEAGGLASSPGMQASAGGGTDGADAGAGAGASQRGDGRVTVDVPPDVEEAQMLQLVQALRAGNLRVSMSFAKEGRTEIRADRADLQRVNRVVRETLNMPGAVLHTTPVQAARGTQPDPPPPQGAASFRLPSAFLSTPATPSHELDKNLTQRADQGDHHSCAKDPQPSGDFSMLDRPSDEGGVPSQSAARPTSRQSKPGDQTEETSFVVLPADSSSASVDQPSGAGVRRAAAAPTTRREPQTHRELSEVMHLTDDQFSRLGLSVDCRAKGIDAEVSLVPARRQVIVSAVNYEQLKKAKHMVKVQSHMVPMRSRSKGRDD